MKLFKKQNLIKNNKKDKGFVILFAVILTSIILSVSLGLADITYKEISFGTSAKNTGDAFFASDAGAECALYYDNQGYKITLNGENIYGYPNLENLTLQCAGTAVNLNLDSNGFYSATGPWVFTLYNLNRSGRGCAIVNVSKTFTATKINTKIISKGYNTGGDNINCFSSSTTRVEREVELKYSEDI